MSRLPSCQKVQDVSPLPGAVLQRADGFHLLAGAEGGESVGETSAIRQSQVRVQLQEGGEDEAAAGDLAVRKGQAVGLELEVAEQEQVDVERARAVTGQVELAAQRP